MPGVTYEAIPPFMDADKLRPADLWLFKLTLIPDSGN